MKNTFVLISLILTTQTSFAIHYLKCSVIDMQVAELSAEIYTLEKIEPRTIEIEKKIEILEARIDRILRLPCIED